MKNKILKLFIVSIFSFAIITSCVDDDTINVKGSVDAEIISIIPTEAKPNYTITISGHGFNDAKEVFFNNIQVLDYDIIDDSTIRLSVPNGAPIGDALITLVYNDNARVTSSFTVLVSEPPMISNYANIQDANNILFEGANFFDLTVTLDNEEVTPDVTGDETELSFEVPLSIKNGLSGTLKIANLDGFLNFKYVSVGDKIYFFQEGSYNEILIEDWDGNGLGAAWDGPFSGVTADAGVYSGGNFGSYLRMTSSGQSWGGGYQFVNTNYGLPEGVPGKDFYLLADVKYNNTVATGFYIIVQLDDTIEPQVIYYGSDLPNYTANPGNLFWSTIPIASANATGDWQTIAWGQTTGFGPRYRNHSDKIAELYPQNALRPEDSDNFVTFKIQVPNDGLVDVELDNVRVIYLN